ncbi:MAG: hypothetical protein IKZ82_09275 [Clostridia bacterium]|nr:hypothetical protein [Clostridia bacterium]
MKKIFSTLLAWLFFAIYTAQSSTVASQFNSYSIFQENLKYLIDCNKSVESSIVKSEATIDDVEAIISRYACQSVAELNKVIDDNLDAVFKTMSDREFKEKTA